MADTSIIEEYNGLSIVSEVHDDYSGGNMVAAYEDTIHQGDLRPSDAKLYATKYLDTLGKYLKPNLPPGVIYTGKVGYVDDRSSLQAETSFTIAHPVRNEQTAQAIQHAFEKAHADAITEMGPTIKIPKQRFL